MAQKEGDNSELAPEIRRILGENQKLKREIKGYQGRLAVLQADKEKTQVKSSPDVSDSSQTESAQAAPEHLAHEWEESCPDCGGKNPNYKGPANVFCGSGKCKGRFPMGHVEPDQIKKLEGGSVEFVGVPKCRNCGSDKDAVLLNG